MSTNSVLLTTLALVAVFISTTDTAVYNSPFFAVTKTTKKGRTSFVVEGNGIHDTFEFTAAEDKTVYKIDKELLIGDKIYMDTVGNSYLIEKDKCSQRRYVFGRGVPYFSLDSKTCANVISNAKRTKANLFPTKFNDEYKNENFDINTKVNDEIKTVQVVGRGVEDQFVLHQTEDVNVYNNSDVLVVGNYIYSDSDNYLVVIENGVCFEREYNDGKLEKCIPLTGPRCKQVLDKMKEFKSSEHPVKIDESPSLIEIPITEDPRDIVKSHSKLNLDDTPPDFTIIKSGDDSDDKMYFQNFNLNPNVPFFTVEKEKEGKETVVKVVGLGVKDVFFFAPNEESDVHTNGNVISIGGNVFTDKSEQITVVYGRMCVERHYHQGKRNGGRELTHEECSNTINNIKNTRINIPSDNNNNSNNTAFTVSIEVVGNGLNDKLLLPEKEAVSIYKKDNILIVDDTYFTDKPNSLTEIENKQCKKSEYIHGYKISESSTDEEECNEVMLQLQLAKNHFRTINTENNTESVTATYDKSPISVKITAFSEFYNKVEVIGNGIQDKFYFPFNSETSMLNTEKTLIIGRRLFTDKKNSLIEIKSRKCQEIQYENGKRVSHTDLDDHICSEIRNKINNVHSTIMDSFDPTASSGGMGSNRNSPGDEEAIIDKFIDTLPDWLQEIVQSRRE